jgi:hypothetical protein
MLLVAQLVKKCNSFHESRSFIAVFTRARQWTLSWARWIQSTLSHWNSFRSIFIFSSLLSLGLRSSLFPSGFPTKILCCLPRPPHSPWFYHPTNIQWWIGLQIIKLLVKIISLDASVPPIRVSCFISLFYWKLLAEITVELYLCLHNLSYRINFASYNCVVDELS